MKQNTILIGLLALLLVVAYIVLQKPGEQSLSSEVSGKLFDFDSLGVDRIEIKTPALDLQLNKRGAEWFLSRPMSYKAAQPVIATVLHQAKNLEVKSIVSSNPEKHSLFLADSSGASVRMFVGENEVAAFIVGKVTSGFSETYVRKLNSDDVAVIAGTFGYVFNRALREWRDKIVTTIPRETITEVKYEYGDTTFVLAFNDSTWTIGRDSTQASAVQDLIQNLSIVTADDFIDSSLSPRQKTSARISYGGIQLRFVFSRAADKYYVQSSASPQWFVMEKWRADQLLKRKKELVKTRT